MSPKSTTLIILLLLVSACFFSPEGEKKDIWVLETLQVYNGLGEVGESYVYTLDSLILFEQLVGAEHPKRRYTYDEYGNILEEVVYETDGQMHSRWEHVFWEYRPGVFVPRSSYCYDARDSLTYTADYDLAGDTLKRRVCGLDFYDRFIRLDEHGNSIEIINLTMDGGLFDREVWTYQLVVDGVYVPERTDYYNKRNAYLYSDIHTLDSLTLYSSFGDSSSFDRELRFDGHGNKIMMKRDGRLSLTSTYQLLDPR